MRLACAVLLLLSLCGQAYGAGPGVAIYRIGEGGQEAMTLLTESLDAKGFTVSTVQGETDIGRHVEKISRINRSNAAVFIAIEILPAAHSRVMVAETEVRNGTGRFLSITEIASRFAGDSDRLANCVAAPFGVRIAHLPLFPLLGVSMPGIAVKLTLGEGDTADVVSKLSAGIEKYFSERTDK